MSLIYNATFDSQTRVLSLLDKAGNVISSCEVPSKELVDDITKPLMFRATQDGSTVSLKKFATPTGSFQTSRDGGNTWSDYTIDTDITINTGEEVSFRAKSNRTSKQESPSHFYFKMTGKIEAWHNVMSLYRTNDFATYKSVVWYAFNQLFEDCASLTKAPALPATTLAHKCYHEMFKGCTSLIKAPALPATTLDTYCYSNMFSGCTSLTNAPALPVTKLASYCYEYMFNGCTSLVNAPELPATTLSNNCYYYMFNGCTSLTKAPELTATTLETYCYYYMFNGCSRLNEVHCKMPSSYSSSDILSSYASNWLSGVSATGTFYTNAGANWPTGSTSGIPTGWTRVNEGAPTVDDITKPLMFRATQDGSTVKLTKMGTPSGAFQTSRDGGNTWVNYSTGTAITLNTGDEVSFRAKSDRTSPQYTQDCFYFEMTGKIEAWHNVMSLYRTNDFATYESVVEYGFYRLFRYCTSLTKAPVLPATTLANKCYSYMFEGCTSLVNAPVLPATTLANYCYQRMFWDCTSLVNAPELPATTLTSSCYQSMFSGCTSLVNAPELPATTLAQYCYSGMFVNCSSLTEAPVLPATTLADDCYQSMFEGCTSLVNAPALPATTLAQYCYSGMFVNCSSLTEAPVLPATTLADDCYQSMFEGCQSLKEVRISATTTATDALKNWLNNVSATGDFYCDPNATIFPTGISGIPANWNRHALADYPVTP